MNPEILELIKVVTPYVLGAISAGGAVMVFIIKIFFATKKEVEQLRQETEVLKNEVDKLPNHDEFYELKVSIEAMRGDLKALVATIEPLKYINNLRLQNDLSNKEDQ